MRLKPIRLVMTLALVILTASLAVDAQPSAKMHWIGYLSPASSTSPGSSRVVEAFRQGLREHGYVEGQNLILEYCFADAKLDLLPPLAAELVRLKVDMIVAAGPAIGAAMDASSTIPIVMASTMDAVGIGFVHSLARPGGNITGLTLISTDLMGKRLELLKETLPQLRRLAFVIGAPGPTTAALGENNSDRGGDARVLLVKATEVAAQFLGVALQILEVGNPDDIALALAAITRERAEALYVTETLFVGRTPVSDLVAQSRLPTFCAFRGCVDIGGLMFYGPNTPDMYRRAATYVDKILKGAKPADLPVEQPMKFELVINLKTAKALGITMPPSLLLLADEVIQ